MGVIHKAIKVRIYPTLKQQEVLNKTLGSCRALYNMMLFERIQTYENWKKSGDDVRVLYEHEYKTEKQYKEEYKWLRDSVDSQALQQSRINLSRAYQNFFKSLKGQRKGTKSGFPKFKKKRTGSSYRTMMTNNNIVIDFESHKVKLPKAGYVSFRDKRTKIDGVIKSATVSRSSTGKYFVFILFEQEN